MNTENITDSMTNGQRHMYTFHRAEAKRRAALAREYDERGLPGIAIGYRDAACVELEAAKKIRDEAKQAAGNRAFRRGPEAFRAYLAGVVA